MDVFTCARCLQLVGLSRPRSKGRRRVYGALFLDLRCPDAGARQRLPVGDVAVADHGRRRHAADVGLLREPMTPVERPKVIVEPPRPVILDKTGAERLPTSRCRPLRRGEHAKGRG